MRKSKNRYFFYHILVSFGDAPGAIMLNVVWMEREFDAYKSSRSMYRSIFNSFPVIRTASAKSRRFHVPQPTFLFPLETPLRLSRNIYIFIHHQDGSTVYIRRLNKIYNLTKKQRMKQSSPNALCNEIHQQTCVRREIHR